MALSSPFICAKLVVVGVDGAQNVKWDSDTSRTFSVVQHAMGESLFHWRPSLAFWSALHCDENDQHEQTLPRKLPGMPWGATGHLLGFQRRA